MAESKTIQEVFDWVFARHDKHDRDIKAINEKLDILLQRTNTMNAAVSQLGIEINTLEATVAAEQTVEQSAITLINGFGAQMAAAIATALANGATQDQLSALTGLNASIQAKSAALAAAVAANTVAAPGGTTSAPAPVGTTSSGGTTSGAPAGGTTSSSPAPTP